MAVDDTTSQDRTTSRDRAGSGDRAGEPVLGSPAARREGHAKVTGAARYAAEHTPPACVYGRPVPATVPHGRVTGIDDSEAMALPGALAVLTHENAPRLGEPDDPILALLQTPQVPHRGWYVALAVAETPETAREMAQAIRVDYAQEPHDVLLRADHPGLYHPEEANGGYPADQETGDFDAEYAAAPHRFDTTYTLSPLHNHPMEPHAATAVWEGGHLIAYDSSQGATLVGTTLAALFGLEPAQVTVVSEHVGGGFGAKGTPRPQVVLAGMAARHTGRAVKVVLPRRELPGVVGHRAPTIQRLRLGTRDDGTLTALGHDVVTHTATFKEFVEQAAVPSRVMYGAAGIRTGHQVVPLDVPAPSWMRAPGEAPGMYALESAMDEVATALAIDPVELRLRNIPDREPDSGKPFSSHHLADCLREGARRFGWERRDPRPGTRRDGDLLLGTGVAAATYPVYVSPSTASVQVLGDGSRPGYQVRINATDIGTGARTVLAQIAAEELGVELDAVRIDIGSSDLPTASLAGGSSGTASWGWAVHKACRELRESGGSIVTVDTTTDVRSQEDYARHAFGAVFAEVAVDTVTGEVRTRRLLGVFAAGRILNARTARSQFIGGMTMGLGMALTEHSTLDARLGGFVERDLAAYHVPAHADVPDIDAHWIEEHDPHLNPVGGKGIGEIGIVGTPAALANAVHHATGTRHRTLPLTPDRVGVSDG
ncbi:xanthine dehydrogenase family protein molybdopterin-binding subunit [Streptomyces sp. WMMB303]|uniref:xanthine dehydrogenase family protein molybdopterin-binding subunit n=1 Tax=Streptomyces sp. WMMB303 TaxID=3034154 RepID=UPI0023ECA9D1|nr:xanthine dehydrogenase family protein molybdopterin-binding subunit [Streptomyces sp. WMMB303]MDF4251830.1 xanthine dehydrogenase family protein molybdopterin-binding subunit [Streptomyces sp. WMMB303]